MRAADSAAPVEVVGGQQLKQTGSVDIASALAVAVPSLNIQTDGADASAVHVLANLRGLSPDDTLVLVNGKRRHSTSNLAVDSGSVFSGSASTDLNYIPEDAIDHIEVLTDGASAQYGSDAIAGVVNIILKKNASGGLIDASGGQYYMGQGVTSQLAYNQGFNLNDKGFVNITLEERTQAHTVLGCGDDRLQSANCAALPVGGGTNATVANLNGVVNASGYPHENQITGNPQSAIYNSFVNGAYDLTPDIQLYGFGNYSYNASEHYENYRIPAKVGACVDNIGSYNSTTGVCTGGTAAIPIPTGFSPSEKFDETDYSITAGAKGSKYGWNWDLSTTYGDNSTKVYVINTANAATFTTLQDASATPVAYPTHTIYDGSFDASEWTGNLDVDKAFEIGLAAPLNVAFGVEGRRNTYSIGAGEPEAYFGSGAQSFFGYAPTDAGNYSRTNVAGYLDLATSPLKNLKVDIAGRFEHYSDFGNAPTGKLTLRYDFSDAIAIRGTISDGFRAPTLAEEFYSGLNVGPTSVSGQLPPNSSAAEAAGFSALRPELSTNYSLGLVLHPIPRLQITLDAYDIVLRDRILTSASFVGLNAYCVSNALTVQTEPNPVNLTCPAGSTAKDVVVAPGVLSAIAGRGVDINGLTNVGVAAFINAVNTNTDGLDATASYASDFGDFGHVDWSLGFNYSHTYVTAVAPLPPSVAVTNPALVSGLGISQQNFLTQISQSQLTTAQPREKAILQAHWTKGPFSVNLRETVYADMSEYATFPTLSKNVLETIPTTGITDLDVGYRINKYLKLDVGADNLLNVKPPITPQGSTGQPINGNTVYNLPLSFAPWNPNGGYYYARVTLTF
ncbi:TonB-dependent siderophore receptor [Caulobacter sp. S45]|uniref:TonB-dependent receptor plug domain-containing protein n=1 Tax=Caulobacter sp. S45 TaxID=1641861 RepID=UPI00131C13F2|nr:TonB-dependent receptor [Caulobacter sp. S45]